MRAIRSFLACAAAFAFAAPASAELVLRGAVWQIPVHAKGEPRGYHAIERWQQPATDHMGLKPRVVVTLANRGPKAAEGAVLRYAVSARLARIGEKGKEGVWTVPFFLNERRVPRIGANQVKDIPLNDLVLAVFLKKSFRAGYWPDAVKIHVMIEPHAGEGLDDRILERALPVAP